MVPVFADNDFIFSVENLLFGVRTVFNIYSPACPSRLGQGARRNAILESGKLVGRTRV